MIGRKIFASVLVMLLTAIAGGARAQSTQIVLPANVCEVEIIRGRFLNLALPSSNHVIADVRVEFANGRIVMQLTILQAAAPDPGSPST